MIIKTKICAGGGRSLTRFPIPRFTMEECLQADGKKLDSSKAMIAFAGEPKCFQIGDNDDDRSLWASLVFCELMNNAYASCVDRADCDIVDHAVTRQDEKIIKRIDRKCVWVRQMITPNLDGVTVKVRVDNPFGMVGQTVEEAESCAVVFVQMWMRIIDQTKVMRISVETTPVIWERAAARNRRADIAKKYAECPRRIAGNCSPCEFGCTLFRDGGKCGYEEVAR